MIMTGYQSVEFTEYSDRLEPAIHPRYGIKINLPQAILLGILFMFLLCFAGYVSLELVGSNTGCLGPPFLYISHHDSHNVLKYTRDGCPLSPNVLWFGSSVGSAVGSIRSMVTHRYGTIKDALYITNAGEYEDETGRVLVFDTCAEVNGMRSFMKTLVDVKQSTGAQHSYSLTFDGHNNMYVSYQHTDAVLRYQNTTYKTMPNVLPVWYDDLYEKEDTYSITPPLNSARNYTANKDFYKGTFVQFGWPGLHDEKTQGIRAITWVEPLQELWVANENLHRILIVDSAGRYVGKIKIKNPVGLHLDKERNMVFVGSKKSSKQTGAVYGIDIYSKRVERVFTLLGGETMNHPTGITVHGDTLFVAEQSMNVVLTFNVTSQRYLKQIVAKMKSGGVEHLALSDC